jgi:hypothetical protein
MANEIKITQVQALSTLRDFIEDSEMVEVRGLPTDALVKKLNAMITSIEKKKSHTSEKDKEKSAQNDRAREIVLDVLTDSGNPLTIAEIYAQSEELSEMFALSNQRLTSLLTKMRKDELVVRSEVKGKAHYAINTDEVDG